MPAIPAGAPVIRTGFAPAGIFERPRAWERAKSANLGRVSSILAGRTSRPQLFTASAGGEHNIYLAPGGHGGGVTAYRPDPVAIRRRAPARAPRGSGGTRIAGRRAPMGAHKGGMMDALIARLGAEQAARAAAMPTDQAALTVLFTAYQRLRELGWQDAIYCPKDGTWFEAIEVGSTGIHRCYYEGKWPDGRWWAADGGDLWPSRPCLFRLLPPTPEQPQKEQ